MLAHQPAGAHGRGAWVRGSPDRAANIPSVMRWALIAASLPLAVPLAVASPPRSAAAQPGSQQTAAETSSESSPVLIDRVVAVVDEDPILLSEVVEVIGLGLVERSPEQSDAELLERVVDGLIEQRLRFHEVDRSGFERVGVKEIEARVAEIESRFEGPAAYQRRLAELGMGETEVRQLVTRQIAVLNYVEERLGARVFVGLDDIQTYYRQTLVPDLESRDQPVPPLDEVREAIRALLHEQRLNQEIERWTEELRRESDVLVFSEPTHPLPPVVDTIRSPTSQ